MKRKIDALIVVEGKTDIDFLSSFLDANFYSVNGSAISPNDLNFLMKVSKKNKIIVLTDPDYPGMRIRNIINSKITKNIYNAYVRKEFSIKKHKVGVAESTIEEVNKALDNLVEFTSSNLLKSNLTLNDLYELKLVGNENSKKYREILEKKLHIGYSNGKQLLNKLKMLNVDKKEIMEILKNVK